MPVSEIYVIIVPSASGSDRVRRRAAYAAPVAGPGAEDAGDARVDGADRGQGALPDATDRRREPQEERRQGNQVEVRRDHA